MKITITFILFFALIACSKNNKLQSQEIKPDNVYHFLSTVELPDKLDFCGEKFPLNEPEVRERAERELLLLLQQPGQLILYFKRSGRYFPMYEKYLKQENVPDDLKYLSVAESALYMSRSTAGAMGLWQFMPETAKTMGLEVNDYVDERRHPEKSTLAAIKYLKQGYSVHKSWILTAAGYNMGHSGVSDNTSFQNSNDYFELFLNEETSRYLFRIAIIKEIMTHPAKYNFVIDEVEKYEPYKYYYVNMDTAISDLSAWAKANGTTYKEVKLLNPWILKRNLPNPGKGKFYEIALPKK
ncbi:MAG TPA: lytic transglycosylase domain-containing protein [Candidatus Kapabacteria bacterium]|nr:lytic transglycosylase domain-containing protein [Candidatus Kapabacteria bacterium]